MPGDLGGALDGPRRRRVRAARSAPRRVLAAGTPRRANPFSNRYRWRASATATSVPGLIGEMHVGRARQRRRPRIDRRPAWRRASAPRARTGTRWMPDADGLTPHRTISAALGIVLVGDRRHLAVERHDWPRRSARRTPFAPAATCRTAATAARRGCPASAGRSSRRTSRAGSTGAAGVRLGARHPLGDQLERFVPRDALELALALRPDAHRRIEQPVRP